MSDKNNIGNHSASDNVIIGQVGAFIRHHRLDQNKSQQQLADEAGINRTTLVDLEQGKRSNLLTLIQLLRALDMLDVLAAFEVQSVPSPMQLAELEKSKRKRAGKKGTDGSSPESDW